MPREVVGAETGDRGRRCPRWAPWVLCLLAANLAWVGFTIESLWPLVPIAFAPYLLALELAADGRRLDLVGLGLLFGTVVCAGGYSWMLPVLHEFCGTPPAGSFLIALVFWLFHGLQYALLGWVWLLLIRRGTNPTLAAVTAFGALELLYPQVFPTYFGACLHGVPVLLQAADLGGPVVLSMLCMAVSGAVYEIVSARLARRRAPRRAPLTVLLVVLLTVVYGAFRIARVDALLHDARTLTVGFVQPNLPFRVRAQDAEAALRLHRRLSHRLEREGPLDLIVWPETAFPYRLDVAPGNIRGALRGRFRSPLLFGAVAGPSTEAKPPVHNTAVLVDADGGVLGRYDKNHLVPFSERMPFRDLIPALRDLTPLNQRVEPSDDHTPLRLGDVEIAVLICYEDILPDYVRQVVLEGRPHLLVNLTDESWAGRSSETFVHLALAKLRAVEHRRPLLRATNSGITSVVDPAGRVVARATPFETATLRTEVALIGEMPTLYRTAGAWPGWAAVAVVVWGIRPRLRRKRRGAAA